MIHVIDIQIRGSKVSKIILTTLIAALFASVFMAGYTYHRDYKVKQCDIGEMK